MNNYIVIDGKKYSTTHGTWIPRDVIPGRVRRTTNSAIDAVYGTPYKEFQGEIRPYHTAPTGWGSYADLLTSLAKATKLAFIDHFGNEYEAAIVGPLEPRSMSPRYDAADNQYLVNILIHV